MNFKYTLEGIEQDDFVFLLRNNHSMFCPFNGNVSESEVSCGSWCPHFHIGINGTGNNMVMITCSGNQINYVLKEDKINE